MYTSYLQWTGLFSNTYYDHMNKTPTECMEKVKVLLVS